MVEEVNFSFDSFKSIESLETLNTVKTIHNPLQYSTFCKIIQKQNSNSKELFYSTPKDKNSFYHTLFRKEFKMSTMDSQEMTSKLFLYIFITSFHSPTVENKFKFLQRVQSNSMIDHTTKTLFFEYFCRAQCMYWRLNRLVYSYKVKKMAIRTETDLYLNPISSSDTNVMTMIHENQKYIFTHTDILKLVYSFITQSSNFYSDPCEVRNPYNNLPFGKSCLYHIYFFLKKRLLFMPTLIHQFFMCDFDLNHFEEENQSILRNITIKRFLNHPGEIDKKCEYIRHMFRIVNYNGKIIIDKDFSKERLVHIMKPYLQLYIFSMYKIDKYERIHFSNILRQKLIRFYKFNPCFGRKKIIIHKSSDFKFQLPGLEEKKKMSISFNDSHIEYNL